MHRQLGSILLLAGALMGTTAWAQTPTAQQSGHLEVAVTYDAALSNQTTSNSFWLQGGSVQVHGQFWCGLGVAADVAGLHVGNIHSSGVGLELVTATFGPRYTWSHRRFSYFGQGLVGEANGFHSVFPGLSGVNSSDDSLAFQVGGGVNLTLSPHLSVRAFEANWVRTQWPNATTSVQNNLRLGTGVIFRLP
jgi:hypothetical protein